MEENTEELDYSEKLKCIVERELNQVADNGLTESNLDIVGKLVDIQKDLENIDYWNCKKEAIKMRYNNYGHYPDERYGRRDRYSRHDRHDDEILDDMRESYNTYSESREAYGRGNYNAGQDSMEALEDTMRLFTEFAEKMINEVDGPEAKQIIRKHLRKISQMG